MVNMLIDVLLAWTLVVTVCFFAVLVSEENGWDD